jgi:hypothetical protein
MEPARSGEPDMRGLGVLALGLAALSAAFAWTYFYSLLAYLAGAVAIPLGVMSRGHERSHAMGTAAVVVTVIALVTATTMLIVVP